jgi:hypothetical protein
MLLIARHSARRHLAGSLSLCLALASIGPTAAVACEGFGEENASLTPIAWSGKGECPTKESQVYFASLNHWCEYELKNNNPVQTLKLTSQELNLNSTECLEKLCLGFIKGVETGQTECSAALKLAAGKDCRIRLEYQNKPASTQVTGYNSNLEGELSGKKFSVEKHQLLE